MNRIRLFTLIGTLIGLGSFFGAGETASKSDALKPMVEYQPRRTPRSEKYKRPGFRYAEINRTKGHQLPES